MHADVSVCTSLRSSPWVKGKHMAQSQCAQKWVQGYLALDIPSSWDCLCTPVETVYMVRLSICWSTLHGKEGVVAEQSPSF